MSTETKTNEARTSGKAAPPAAKSETVEKPEGTAATAAIVADIEATRASMASTVGAIEERLSPAHIKEQIADIKDSVVDQLKDAKDKLKEDLSQDFQQAKKAVAEELTEAKDAVQGELRQAKHIVKEEIDHVKTAAYDATVGRVSDMYDDARDTVTDAGSSLLGTIKANPIPAALVAVGIGWLFMSARSTKRAEPRQVRRRIGPYGYEEEEERASSRALAAARGAGGLLADGQRAVSRAAHSVGEGASSLGHRIQDGASGVVHRVGDLAHEVGDSAGRLGSEVSHGASDLAHRAADRAEHWAQDARDMGRTAVRTTRETAVRAGRGVVRAEQSVEHTYDEYPLAFGVGAVAVGLAVGLSLPHTRREDEWLGEAKERLVERAHHAAQDAIHGAEEKVDTFASLATSAQKAVRSLSTS
jgi:hypothetical protein